MSALLRRVPGIAWVILFVLALLTTAAFALVRLGEQRARVSVVQAAERVQEKTVAAATVASDHQVAQAAHVVRAVDASRIRTRVAIAAAADSAPPALIEIVSAQLAQDSTALAIQSTTINTLLVERTERIHLDSLRVDELHLRVPDVGVSIKNAAVAVGVVAIVVEAVRLTLQLLHR